jgi:hypothetical protein
MKKTKSPNKAKRLRDAATENTKYARDTDENTKYAKNDENTKYARDAENTKYASAENTKYGGGKGPRTPTPASALARRQAVDAAVEETLMSASAAVDRVHPGISADAKANLVGKVLDKFGEDLMEAHLDVILAGGERD